MHPKPTEIKAKKKVAEKYPSKPVSVLLPGEPIVVAVTVTNPGASTVCVVDALRGVHL